MYQSSLPLTPVICTVPPDTLSTYHFILNPDEVAEIFHVPLTTFLNTESSDSCSQFDHSAVASFSNNGVQAPLHSNGFIGHVVEKSDTFDLHHFNVTFGGNVFDVRGLTAHICICVALLGLKRAPSFQYRLPTEYCVFEKSFSEKVTDVFE